MDRRSFLRVAGSAGGALCAGMPFAAEGPIGGAPAVQTAKEKSKVIVARRPDRLLVEGKPNPKELADLLGKGISALLNEKDPVDAWKRLFSPNDRVSVKVNALGGKGIATRPEVVAAVCQALQTAGVRPDRILVWDRFARELKRAGYEIVTTGSRPRCFGTDSLSNGGYDRNPQTSGTIGSCFSSIISRGCTAMINVGVLKHHDLSGISVALKNLFGLIHNPNRYHFDVHKDPYLPDLAAHPYVRKKSRLVIIDALTAQYEAGPGYKPEYCWPFGGLLIGVDAVAVDRVGCTILEAQRKEAGLPSLAEIDREPKYIQLAEEKGLGCSDPSKIDIVEVS